ncbi:hypothetical protein TI39_contig5824g00001 [Zymoseptoria brevis]|uniref:Uncharacterized protein n=1 Tax=Zymoseptoria brevis TaxID=1047168 RepID=A0A0F4G974_9PEZI|nr:hypothetical protein TI39_contig5824g00001 [Zymoseptoria brevis]
MGLLNFGDRTGRIAAIMFTLVAVAAMVYALVTFHWRAKSIRGEGDGERRREMGRGGGRWGEEEGDEERRREMRRE